MSEKPAPDRSASIPVVYGPPPLSWLWDYRPLSDEAWGNIQGFNDGTGDGHTIEMRRWVRAMPSTPLMNMPPIYRPAGAPLPPFIVDGGTRRCYIPSPADLEIVRRWLPDTANPVNPNWSAVSAKLLTKGYRHADLERLSPPELLALLDAALSGTSTPPAGAQQDEEEKPRAGRRKGTPSAEANVRVRNWLLKHAKDNPAAITRDAVAAGTGLSTAAVSRTAAWKAFRERRDAEAKRRVREVPLTDTIQAVTPDDCKMPDELAILIEEQRADMAEETRCRKPRT